MRRYLIQIIAFNYSLDVSKRKGEQKKKKEMLLAVLVVPKQVKFIL